MDAVVGDRLNPFRLTVVSKTLHFANPRHLNQLYAGHEENLTRAEQLLGVTLVTREDWLKIEAPAAAARTAEELFTFLDAARTQGMAIRTPDFERITETFAKGDGASLQSLVTEPLVIPTNRKSIIPKTLGQKLYLQSILRHDIVFGIGPAGTGKTYLAVAVGVSLFLAGEVERIVLSRPAVEAGERLGFLPGDMREKIDPYMQPLYDALNDFIPARQVQKLIEEKRIEIAPLAFMRGRTLAHAFVVLDEAQNATTMQMKMFLTRLGEGSRMVITGDRTQVDLPRGTASGLADAERILAGVPGVSFSYFTARDVVRHPLVARIIEAYGRDEATGG